MNPTDRRQLRNHFTWTSSPGKIIFTKPESWTDAEWEAWWMIDQFPWVGREEPEEPTDAV